jgi:hypothetical protein
MFVKDLDLDVYVTIDPLFEIIEDKGIVKNIDFLDRQIKSFRFGDVYPFFEDDIKNNRSRNISTFIGAMIVNRI